MHSFASPFFLYSGISTFFFRLARFLFHLPCHFRFWPKDIKRFQTVLLQLIYYLVQLLYLNNFYLNIAFLNSSAIISSRGLMFSTNSSVLFHRFFHLSNFQNIHFTTAILLNASFTACFKFSWRDCRRNLFHLLLLIFPYSRFHLYFSMVISFSFFFFVHS